MISRCFVFKFHDVEQTTLFRFSKKELEDLPPLTGKRRTVGVYTDTGHSFINEDPVPRGDKRTKSTGKWTGISCFETKEGARTTSDPDDHPKCPGPWMTDKGPHREVRQSRQTIHCTDGKNTKSLEWSKDKRFDRPKAERRTLIEVCCSDKSLLCADRFRNQFSNVVRITEKDNFTTQSGLEKVIAAITDPEAGRVTLWFSTPCTWGTQARNRNKYLQTKYVGRSCELFDQFLKLLQINFHLLLPQ